MGYLRWAESNAAASHNISVRHVASIAIDARKENAPVRGYTLHLHHDPSSHLADVDIVALILTVNVQSTRDARRMRLLFRTNAAISVT